ncbi:hypothetical protein SAMN04515648_4519 [Phyllobacterium sp. CL33Tsu]|nr:hypothetical protein SAMN04515648_4519 [Phyllobacterium sp. CL33Tsu]
MQSLLVAIVSLLGFTVVVLGTIGSTPQKFYSARAEVDQ